MRNIRQVFENYVDANWHDQCCQNIDINFFKSFLENCKVLLYFNDEFMMANAGSVDNMFDYKILKRKSNDEDELYNYIVKDAPPVDTSCKYIGTLSKQNLIFYVLLAGKRF